MAIVLESTTAADIPSAAGEKRVCEVGKGPVVSYMDRRTIYDKQLYALAFDTARGLALSRSLAGEFAPPRSHCHADTCIRPPA